MSSKTTEIMYAAIQSDDLLYSGRQLIEFANAVYKEKNRTTLIKFFYEQLNQWAFSSVRSVFGSLLEDNKSNYFICDEKDSVKIFLGLRIPRQTSTVKSINQIRTFGEFILSNFASPVGECISEASLKEILHYLDEKHNFSTKVFSSRKSYFIRMNNSNKDYNSECLTRKNMDGTDVINHFFLYHMKEKNSISPEAVLFHELGHALHAKRFGGIDKLPNDIIERLQDICFPEIKTLDSETQNELFADVLGIGLMYQTPYEKYDVYKDTVSENHKKIFKIMVEKIMEDIYAGL
jgi:hypothetical protein